MGKLGMALRRDRGHSATVGRGLGGFRWLRAATGTAKLFERYFSYCDDP
jgi:hypothetical protein